MRKSSGWQLRAAAACVLLCATAGASAADLGFYAIVDGAYNTAHISLPRFNSVIAANLGSGVADTAVDTNGKGFDLTVGYQLGSYFGVEGSYVISGRARYDFIDLYNSQPGSFKAKLGGPTVAAVGLLPLGDYFSLDGHAGLFFVDQKYTLSEAGAKLFTVSDSKTSIYLGAGAAWWITGQVALRFGYNWFHHALLGEDASQFTLGLRYSYGY